MNKDQYFLGMARAASKRCKCGSRQIGSVLVKNGWIIGTGYNGAPVGVRPCWERNRKVYNKFDMPISVSDGECPRKVMGYGSGQGLEYCPAAHSEVNAIISAARNGVSTEGTTLYCYCGMPCQACAAYIINAGVKEVVCIEDSEYRDTLNSKDLFYEADVLVRVVKPEDD